MFDLTVRTWSTSSADTDEIRVTLPAALPLREIIALKARREVEEYNAGRRRVVGLEHSNGAAAPPPLDAGTLAQAAEAAHRGQVFCVIVDGLQVDDLDMTVEIGARSRIEFVRM